MRKTGERRERGALAAAVLVFAVLCQCGVAGGADAPLPLAKEFWRDASFLRSFNGSYRIEARIEPVVTGAERGVLVQVQKLMAKGERKEAARVLGKSKLTPDSAALRFNLGNIFFELGESERAAGEYRAAIKIYPSFRRAHRNLAVALVRLGKPDKALGHLMEALRLGDSDSLTWGLLGWCRGRREEWAGALQAYRMARALDPQSAEWMAGAARCLAELDRRAEALGLLDEVVRARPADASYGLLRVRVLLSMGRATKAAAGLDFLRRIGSLDADSLLLLASLHLRAGRTELSGGCIDAAFAAPQKPSAGRVLAALREAVERQSWGIARKLEQAALGMPEGMTPDETNTLTSLRARIAIGSGIDPEAGEAALRKLLAADPLAADALLALGRRCAATQRPDEAELLFTRAALDESLAREAWVEIARARVARHRYPEAVSALDEALRRGKSEELKAYRAALARLAEAAK